MKRHFGRKIFTPGLFFRDLGFLISHAGNIRAAMKDEALGAGFREKIMLVVTAVNGCPYCTWFHAKKAVSSGLAEGEIENMLKLQFGADATPFETPGLLYAQHYAETDRHPDADMNARFRSFYGEERAGHIYLFIRMIFFGNLYGNTFDAFPSRIKGLGAEGSNAVFEFLFFVLNAPLFWPLARKLKKKEETAEA